MRKRAEEERESVVKRAPYDIVNISDRQAYITMCNHNATLPTVIAFPALTRPAISKLW
jgi:hypothetical protein